MTFKGMKGMIHYIRVARDRRDIEYLHRFRTAIFSRWLLDGVHNSEDEKVVDLNKVIEHMYTKEEFEQEPKSRFLLCQYRYDYPF